MESTVTKILSKLIKKSMESSISLTKTINWTCAERSWLGFEVRGNAAKV